MYCFFVFGCEMKEKRQKSSVSLEGLLNFIGGRFHVQD